jgi:site-specific recombinase XerD
MTISAYVATSKLKRSLYEGPLGIHIDLYAAQLLKEGHCRQSAWRCLRVVSDFSHWLGRKRISLAEVDEQTVERYQEFRSRNRCPFSSDQPALNRLLTVLRGVDAIQPKCPAALGSGDAIFEQFRRYLAEERGLACGTIARHELVVRRFVRERCEDDSKRFRTLRSGDILGFIKQHAGEGSPRSAQIMCGTLREFMRYLHYRGYIRTDLATSVPTIRRWRLASLPEYLLPHQVQKVLDACDRRSAIGRRDYAILLMLARLGLRANEIATLTLDDIDWQAGQMSVQAKGRQRAQLPLPQEVGSAVVAYLQSGRPQSNSRRLFLRDLAPHSGFASSGGISMIAATALKRAGIQGVAHKGSHLFRHSLATALLRAGASLAEIGQVLRHQDHNTTRIYAKVDIDSLRLLSLRWPGGVR